MRTKEIQIENFNECLETVRYILERLGTNYQDGTRAYSEGELRFERTNTGEREVRMQGELVLSVPLVGSRQQVIWQLGDWVQMAHEIRARAEG